MAHTLHLTAAERKLFDALPADLKKGYDVVEEKGSYKDSPEKHALRVTFLHVQHPSLRFLQKSVKEGMTHEEFFRHSMKLDFNGVSNVDLSELLFALGPEGISAGIDNVLRSAKDDEALQLVSVFTGFRRLFLESAQAVS